MELKDCPFCGSSCGLHQQARLDNDGRVLKDYEDKPLYFWWVECNDGGCEGRTGLAGMQQTAVEIWNKRADAV